MALRQKGFTLIELLVVIAVIGVLSSIVLASLNTARTKASIAAGKQFSSQLDRVYGAAATAMWDFNEGSDNATYDKTGTNPWSSVYGHTWVTGVNGTAISLTNVGGVWLTGNNDPKPILSSPTFTIAFWLKPNSIATGWNALMTAGISYVDGFRMAINASSSGSGPIQFWTTQSGGTLNITSTKKVDTDRWYHVAVTYASEVGNIYIDGKIVGTGSGTYNTAATSNAYLNSIGGTASADAIYDDLRIFSESLLASEVYDLYAESLEKHNTLAYSRK